MRPIVLFVGLVLMAGCALTTTPDESKPHKPDVPIVDEKVIAADVWETLARRVDKGTIQTADRLSQIVKNLARNGDLSVDDVASYDSAFKNQSKGERLLDSQDSARLRGIK
jgi:hypothetical protein